MHTSISGTQSAAVRRLLQDAQTAPSTTQTPQASDSTNVVANQSEFVNLVTNPELWFGIATSAVKIVLILLLTWLIIRVIDKATRRWIRLFDSLPELHPRRQRALTVGSLLTSSARYILWPLAIIMVLSEFKFDVTALLATAGIAGIALGFGAQTLVQDFISGIFLLFDDTIHIGDLVSVGSHEGTVEHIGVRLIKVRRFNGELLMVPAGEIRTFGNRSIDYVRLIVNVGLAYEQNLDTILPVMQQVADKWAEENPDVLKEEKPVVQAITDFGESTVNARIVMMVTPGSQFEAERELRQRIKREFDQQGIEIPFPRRSIYVKEWPKINVPDPSPAP